DACPSCISITDTVQRLAEMARYALPHTNHKLLSHEQLRDLLRDRMTTINYWKLRSLSLMRKCANVLRKVSDYSRFLMAVSTYDVPRVRQIIAQARKNRASVSKIVHLIEEAMRGTYHARGYEDKDRDLSLLALRL
ncbi:hypothetical protein K474DRAFT_1583683, partial [Panus rudis PR-1116 ss-1]